MKILSIILISLIAFCMLGGDCRGQESGALAFTGHVKRFTYEGGFFGIVDGSGNIFKPVELLPSFRIENLSVKVIARPVKGAVFTKGRAMPIEIIKIERYNRR